MPEQVRGGKTDYQRGTRITKNRCPYCGRPLTKQDIETDVYYDPTGKAGRKFVVCQVCRAQGKG